MKQNRIPFPCLMANLMALILIISGCSENDQQIPFLENRHIKVTLSEDLTHVSSLMDIRRNREYIHQEDQVPLFRIGTGWILDSVKYLTAYQAGITGDPDSMPYLTPDDASRSSWRRLNNALELSYWFRDPEGFKVTCRLEAPENDSLIYWSLIIDPCPDTVMSVQYPVLSCTDQLRVSPSEGGIVYPVFEGSIMKNVHQAGFKHSRRYPGYLGSQLLYYFDSEGGIYYAAHDGNGHHKNLSVRRSPGGSISMNQEYLIPAGMNPVIGMPYRVATGCFGGTWEQGAAVYRNWSERQLWTSQTIPERDMPGFLKEPVFFINISIPAEEFNTAEKTDRIAEAYHQYFGMPVVVTGFGWEKHGGWLGPDYFPPVHGWDYYRELAQALHERGDHLHVYTSGFRVAVEAREGTEFDGYDYFKRHWKASAAIVPSGTIAVERRTWAKNYMLCIGDTRSTELLAGIHEELFLSGISGVDLDQNLGGEQADCYSDAHGHPVGPGSWMAEALQGFLGEVRSTGKKISDRNFTGMEEPCEYYIQELDVAHGRSFAATSWPAEPGGICIPLYLYLYHPYNIDYAGWIDANFSPLNDERIGIGRAFIFGMAPGVRVRGKMALPANKPSIELRMLKGYTQLFSRYPDHLVRGRMIGEIDLEGAPFFQANGAEGADTLITGWKDVQGICWSRADGEDRIYALSNLSNEQREVSLIPDSRSGSRFMMTGYALDVPVNRPMDRNEDGSLTLSLEPWQLTVIEPASGRIQ